MNFDSQLLFTKSNAGEVRRKKIVEFAMIFEDDSELYRKIFVTVNSSIAGKMF
jgi:hypothetical protein